MLNIKKTIRNTTIILIFCIFVIAFFEIAPIIEDKFSDRYFIVTFDLGVGDSYEVMVTENNPVIKPETPKKDGYKFVGWYYKNKEYNFSTYVTKSIRINAVWEKIEEETTPDVPEAPVVNNNRIKVKFDVMGGSLIPDQDIVKGGTASIPQTPTREGYTFVEWQVNGKTFDFGTLLYEDITIVAIWKEN